MRQAVDKIGMDLVVVNGNRIEVDPPFETVPDLADYENWLHEVMESATQTIGSREEVPSIKDHFVQIAQGRQAH